MSKKEQLERLAKWAADVESEIQHIKAQMAPLQVRFEAAKEKLDLIHRLNRLEEKGQIGTQPSGAQDKREPLPELVIALGDVENQMEKLLMESGEPMHIKKIRQGLIDRGVPLPGRGDEANIIVRLRRSDKHFTRTGRGTYALAKWGIPEAKPTRTKKRSVRRAG